MKTMEITLWHIPLTVTFYQYEDDAYDPQRGHYTIPGKWLIESIEHKGTDICDIVSEEVIWLFEGKANNEIEYFE